MVLQVDLQVLTLLHWRLERRLLVTFARGTRNIAILNALLGQNFDQSLVSGFGGALGAFAVTAPIPIPGARIAGALCIGSSFFGDMYSRSGMSIPYLNQNLNDLGIPDLGDGARFIFEKFTKSEVGFKSRSSIKANTLS